MNRQEKDRLKVIYKQSVLKSPYTKWSFAHRFWVFQNERIPILVMTIVALSLTAAIAKANNNLDWPRIFIACFIVVLYFLQIRLADEPKDYEHDSKFYPQRPVQRGVITLKELSYLKNATIAGFFILAALTSSLEIFVVACFQQFYSYLTRKEFFVRDWLREHFITYQFSHYVQLLILDWLILTVLHIEPINEKLIYFIFVIIMMGMIEASRTIGGTDGHKAKDRYSYFLGVNQALLSFVSLTVVAAGYTIFLVQRLNGDVKWFILILGLLIVCWSVIKYKQKPTMKHAELMNGASLLMYLSSVATLYFK